MTGATTTGHHHLLQYLHKSKHFTNQQKGDEEEPSTWTESEQLVFLTKVTGRPLTELLAEPQRFSQEASRIQAELSALAFAEYKSFLRAHASSRGVREELLALDGQLTLLSSSFDDLSMKVDKVLQGTEKFACERQSVGQIVLKQDQILELLEIPQLLDTFVKNGHYEEAMDLCLFTRRIRDRSPDLEILQHIGEQVAQGTLLMQEQLISLLSGPIKLPLCIRVIGYLRRMDLFSGPDLKRVFLSQRDAHMTFLLDQVRAQDPLEYLKKHIEVSRESLFDILTQYSAIFTESFSASSGNSGSTITVEPACSSQAILSFYTTSVIQDLLDVLQDKLTLFTDAAAISTILTQVLYYGLSLGRMGFDFRHWMVEVFEEAMLRLVASGLNSGTEAFIEGLRSIPDGPWESGAASSTHALSDLLSIPLLAALFNTYMAALNQLRILPILSTRSSVLSTVRSQLRDALEAVSRLGGERMDDWPEERLIAFERLNLVLSDVFLPQISSGLEAVYGRPLEEPLSPILPDSLLFKWASNARRRSTIVSNTHAM